MQNLFRKKFFPQFLITLQRSQAWLRRIIGDDNTECFPLCLLLYFPVALSGQVTEPKLTVINEGYHADIIVKFL